MDSLSELILRSLDDTNSTSNTTDHDGEHDDKADNSTDTGDNTGDETNTGGSTIQEQLMAYEKFGFIILAVLILFCLCFTWRCCKRRRERRNLELDSARADNVLGDMAMVPTEDVDEDAELL